MVIVHPNISSTPRTPLFPQKKQAEKHKKAAVALAALSSVASVIAYATPWIDKQPRHTSILTGEGWVKELLCGQYKFHLIFNQHLLMG
jgi:hypothetical protein